MAKINDDLIKQLINRYQQTGEGYSDILEHLSEYIYNFPRIRFSEGEDVCGDFFLYFCERLEGSLMKYQMMDCQFTSWLIIVMRRHYLNWVKKNKSQSPKNITYLEDYATHNDFSYDQEVNSSTHKGYEMIRVLEALQTLPSKVRIVMKLHYFSFFQGEDLLDISQVYQIPLSTLLERYDAVLDHIQFQCQKENELQDKLNSLFHQVSELEERLSSSGRDSYRSEDRNSLQEKLVKAKSKHEKALCDYQRFYISVKSDQIAELLGVKANAVHNLIFRGKALLKQKLMDEML